MRLVFLIIIYFIFIPVGNTADFAKYKSTCADIGFAPDTDPFADCVLELYKRDKVKVKQQVEKENAQREAQEREARQRAIEGAKATREAQEREARQRQVLEIEKRRYKEEERRRKQEAINRQFEREQKGFQMMIDMGKDMQRGVDERNRRNREQYERSSCMSTCRMESSYQLCKRICD